VSAREAPLLNKGDADMLFGQGLGSWAAKNFKFVLNIFPPNKTKQF
jgi:hypothetical protein